MAMPPLDPFDEMHEHCDPVDPTPEEIERALLGRPASMGRREVSQGAGVSLLSARRFWHALGFPNVNDDDTMFTEADLQALRAVARLVRTERFDDETALAMTRAVARTTDRLSVWQTQLMAETLARPGFEAEPGEPDSRAVPGHEAARAAAIRLAELADDLEPLLIYAWRRHLTAAIARMLADADPDEPDAGPYRMIGFADLVSFTSLVRRLTEKQLAVVVQRFERLASDIVTAHGGRVIKTVGDEVLFVTVEAAPAAAIALDLVEAMTEDELLPDARVGMAAGHVVSRLGDVFGTTVNRASRLTAAAAPGTVLVDDAVAAHLKSVSGFETAAQRRRTLRGIGSVTPSVLRRTSGGRRVPEPDADPGSAPTADATVDRPVAGAFDGAGEPAAPPV